MKMKEEGVSGLLKTVLESQYYTESYLCYVHLTWTDLELQRYDNATVCQATRLALQPACRQPPGQQAWSPRYQ